jgi:hypothetical protein
MAEATATAAAAPSPPPPTTAAAATVLFFLFSTTGPFQGHTLPFQGSKYFYFKFINFSISYFK